MLHALWMVPLAVLAIPAVIGLILFVQIKALSRPDLELVPAERHRFASAIADSQSHDAWLMSQGFNLVACCRLNAMKGALITAWQHTARPSYICIYHLANQRNYDMVTLFADDVHLTTGSTADGMLLPTAPGGYCQCFPKTSFQKMWQRHIEAEEYLISSGAVALSAIDRPFQEIFVESIRRQADHVQTIPFWPLRGAYWYFVRRTRLAGKTVSQLVAMGVYPRPADLFK
ncbi:MAG: hypothetical protein ACOX1P_24190 [Thermoguttaceae bacterium]|jgi:hypothetical protein